MKRVVYVLFLITATSAFTLFLAVGVYGFAAAVGA